LFPGFSRINVTVRLVRTAREIQLFKGDIGMGFFVLAGGFLIIIFAVVVSVVSSVVSAIAADQDVED